MPACKAVGGLMHQADLGEQIDCRLLSFLDSLRILRDTVANTRNAATAPLPKFYQGKLKL